MPDLEELRQDYTAIQVVVNGDGVQTLGAGRRILFWVAGDGRRTAVFTTAGEFHVVHNAVFTLVGVYGAEETDITNGRIRYRSSDGEWTDVGPHLPEGHRDTDIPIADARRAIEAGESIDAKIAASRPFWEEGGAF